MAMQAVLKKLETRIGELVERYEGARRRIDELEKEIESLREAAAAHEAAAARIAELEANVAELEKAAASGEETGRRAAELEARQRELAGRLEQVLERIDGALAGE